MTGNKNIDDLIIGLQGATEELQQATTIEDISKACSLISILSGYIQEIIDSY